MRIDKAVPARASRRSPRHRAAGLVLAWFLLPAAGFSAEAPDLQQATLNVITTVENIATKWVSKEAAEPSLNAAVERLEAEWAQVRPTVSSADDAGYIDQRVAFLRYFVALWSACQDCAEGESARQTERIEELFARLDPTFVESLDAALQEDFPGRSVRNLNLEYPAFFGAAASRTLEELVAVSDLP